MFYDRFIELCENKNVKPSRVALDIGINKGTASVWRKEWENGNNVVPSTRILTLLADYFGVTPDYLLEKSDNNIDDIKTAQIDTAKVALFGGAEEVTDEMWEEVKEFVEFVKQKHSKRNDG